MRSTEPGPGRRAYFFLSYAHVPPITDVGFHGRSPATLEPEVAVEDPVVDRFFLDLSEQVGRLAKRPELRPGFYDQFIPAGEDWSGALAEALGSSEVMVPLYSPSYVNGVWSLSERRSFQHRLDRAGGSAAHVQPVLWIPVPGNGPYGGDDPLEVGRGIDGYADDGLRAMHELTYLNVGYHEVVRRLARRIVAVAEQEPLHPSPAEQPSDLVDEVSTNAQFIVAVVAPRETELQSTGRSTSRYGPRGREWRPFDGASAARQVANIAERLGLPTDIVDLPEGTAELRNHPAILLIDPWIMALRDGRERLTTVLTGLEAWVTPIVVTDVGDPQYADRGEVFFRAALGVLDASRGRPTGAHGINQVETFVTTMPKVIDQTRGSFLRSGPTVGTSSRRPRLSEGPAQDGPGENG
jgi:FxsC-like protein